MRIFVAGATGAMGVPLVKRPVAAGHQVTGMTRSESKRSLREGLGATAAVADVFDTARLGAVLQEARPEAVVHLLTALPKLGPARPADLVATNRLRIEGTKNLAMPGPGASSTGGPRTPHSARDSPPWFEVRCAPFFFPGGNPARCVSQSM